MMLEVHDPRGRHGHRTSMTVCLHLLLDSFFFLTFPIIVNAIIFLAPISAFDQTLAEDPKVNRLEDSMLLWKSVVSNKLLENVNIILFLDKCDLLRVKLEAGVLLAYHMVSYGERSNDYDPVSHCEFLLLYHTLR